MRSLRQHDRHGMRHRRLALAAALLLIIALPALPAPAREAEEARSALRQLSSAFTQVAQDAMPAVVFIQVEKILPAAKAPLATTTLLICLAKNFSNASLAVAFPNSAANRANRASTGSRDKGRASSSPKTVIFSPIITSWVKPTASR
jgi:S1-C subfamily serine protease